MILNKLEQGHNFREISSEYGYSTRTATKAVGLF